MANSVTTFVDATALATRTTEQTTASWVNGMNSGTCQPGIGIATDNPLLEGDNWTLTDQFAAARTPQDGQSIGGVALNEGNTTAGGWTEDQTFNVITNDADGDGTATLTGTPHLVTLAAGWAEVALP